MFEHRHAPLLSRVAFAWRVLRHAAVAFGIVAAALGLGVAGYRFTEGMRWVDAIMNAAVGLTRGFAVLESACERIPRPVQVGRAVQAFR